MGRRHPNYRLIKSHRTYDVDELAFLLGVCVGTVRNWHKRGLLPIDGGRPVLFKGATIIAFLKARRERAKRPCSRGEMYCLPCHMPQRPAADMAEYVAITSTSGNLRAICPRCERFMYRRVSRAKLRIVMPEIDVYFTQAESHLTEGAGTCEKYDSARAS